MPDRWRTTRYGLLGHDLVGYTAEPQGAVHVPQVIALEPSRADQEALRDEEVGDMLGRRGCDIVDLAEERRLLDPGDRIRRAVGLEQIVTLAELLGLDQAASAAMADQNGVLASDAQRATRRGGQLVDGLLGIARLGRVAQHAGVLRARILEGRVRR